MSTALPGHCGLRRGALDWVVYGPAPTHLNSGMAGQGGLEMAVFGLLHAVFTLITGLLFTLMLLFGRPVDGGDR